MIFPAVPFSDRGFREKDPKTRMTEAVVRTPTDRKIPTSTRMWFGLGQIAEGLKTFSFNTFILFYYNHILGLSGTMAGLAIGIALLFDAVSDPLMGSISDNFRSKWGRRHPFMVIAAGPLALCYFGLFAPPSGLSPTDLFVWLTTFAVLTRLSMTVYHVPHMALGAEMTANYEDRTRLVATRQIFGYVGAFVMAAIGFGHFFADERGGRMNAEAYAPFGLVMSLFMVTSVLASAWMTRDQIPFLPQPAASDHQRKGIARRLVKEAMSAFENQSFKRLFRGILLIYVLVGTEGALALYMYEFFWALDANGILMLTLLYPVGLMVGAFFTARLHRRWDKSTTLIFGTAGWCVCQLLPVVLRLLELLPPNGTVLLIGTLLAFRLFQGALVQQALASFSSMMADIADEHELESGRRQEGIFFGVVSLSGKLASGLGSIIAGVALDVISWPAGLGGGDSSVELPAEMIRNLGILYGPMVAIFALLAPFAYRGYSLNRERHTAVLVALQERHRETDAP